MFLASSIAGGSVVGAKDGAKLVTQALDLHSKPAPRFSVRTRADALTPPWQTGAVGSTRHHVQDPLSARWSKAIRRITFVKSTTTLLPKTGCPR